MLKAKVDAHPDEVDQEIRKLDPSDDSTISWAAIAQSAYIDPEQMLTGYLKLTGDNVSQREAKWRAVLSNILNKSQEPRAGHYFTEREEVFCRTLNAIANCSGGKAQGIDAAYHDLETENRYKIQLPGPKTVKEIEEENKNKEGLNHVDAMLKNISPQASLEEKIQILIKTAHQDTRTSSEKLNSLLSDEKFWDISEDYKYFLNPTGAHKLLKIRATHGLSGLIASALQRLIDYQFTGTNALMETLTGQTLLVLAFFFIKNSP